MGFSRGADSVAFKTLSKRYSAGFSLVINLSQELPRKYDELTGVGGSGKGYLLSGMVEGVFAGAGVVGLPVVGSVVSVLVRPGDVRKVVFDDLDKTKEGFQFLLEGVSMIGSTLEARWAHGAGVSNRSIAALEIVGAPHVSFENPIPDDGPQNGWLSLNLDGSPTEFDIRDGNGGYDKHEIMYDDVVGRLKTVLDTNLRFRVGQRVLAPSLAKAVSGQVELEAALAEFRKLGFTSCVVRSYVSGTSDPKQVDVQILSWPLDQAANNGYPARVFDIPVLQESKRFAEIRDGATDAEMEVIPGYVLSLVGNKDAEKSTKHKFARNIVKGLSSGQKAMYGALCYGPGVSVCAVNNGEVLGLTRLAVRVEGAQYQTLMSIPTRNFVDADKIKSYAEKLAETGSDTPESN